MPTNPANYGDLNDSYSSTDDSLELTESAAEGSSDLIYPVLNQVEIPNFLQFTRKQYQRVNLQAESNLVTPAGARVISLPVPQVLEKSYNSDWTMEDLGIWGNVMSQNAGKMYNTFKEAYSANEKKDYGAFLGSLKDAMSDVGWSKIAGNVMTAWGADAATNNDLFRMAGREIGVARNPFKAVLFTSPMFRNFTFSYKLVARNLTEAIAIKDIIKEFQIGMSPDFESIAENNIYTYPDIFEINFTEESEFLFRFAPCALRNCVVNYHAEGTPVYFRDSETGARVPGIVTLQLEFTETTILTRKEFEEGY